MFVDAVWANLVVFAVGQVFAWLYLRSGRFWAGTVATTLLWVAVDWWLVGRYAFGAPAADQRLPLLLLQATAVTTTAVYLWARLRRRMAAALRGQRFRSGMRQLLADELEPARVTFRQLIWVDPWDAAAWIALGDVARRSGEVRRARWYYRRAGAVDVKKAYADLLQHRSRLIRGAPADRSAASKSPVESLATPTGSASVPTTAVE